VILVDSDVLVAHLRGIPQAKDWLLRARRDTGRLATSTVSVAEVAGGMWSQERHQVTRLLSSLDIFPVSERVGWKAAELMRTYRRPHSGIGLGDFLIAATAAVEGLQLATFNIRHFPMFPDLHTPFDLPRPDDERQ
jgi:predicted nucleic acid-binding protein